MPILRAKTIVCSNCGAAATSEDGPPPDRRVTIGPRDVEVVLESERAVLVILTGVSEPGPEGDPRAWPVQLKPEGPDFCAMCTAALRDAMNAALILQRYGASRREALAGWALAEAVADQPPEPNLAELAAWASAITIPLPPVEYVPPEPTA